MASMIRPMIKFKRNPTRKNNDMDFTTYVRKPFVVEAVEITPDNIAEVAKHVGDLREKEDGTQYILVDRRLVPNVFRVYTGYYMTKMNENIRCYSRKIFREQFIEQDETIKPWVDFLNKDQSDTAPVFAPNGSDTPSNSDPL